MSKYSEKVERRALAEQQGEEPQYILDQKRCAAKLMEKKRRRTPGVIRGSFALLADVPRNWTPMRLISESKVYGDTFAAKGMDQTADVIHELGRRLALYAGINYEIFEGIR